MLENKVYLVLHNIRSRENVGSIFRTADAVGVSKIYLCGITPRPPHQKISKTALGAEKYVSWEYYKRTANVLKKLKEDNIFTIALEKTKKSENIFEYKSRPLTVGRETSLALILGNEIRGISPGILKIADKTLHIPMFGKKESLNVSVAVGIALYQLLC